MASSAHHSFSYQPQQSVSRVSVILPRPSIYGEMATGDMLQEMVAYNERSTSTSPLLYPVDLSHQATVRHSNALSFANTQEKSLEELG